MPFLAIADESHIHSKSAPCYGIGCFLVDSDGSSQLDNIVRSIFAKHGLEFELKWNRIRPYHPAVETTIEAVHTLLSLGATFHAMVVEKRTYSKWKGNKEEAFYTTYYQLARHVVSHAGGPVELLIDERTDRYPKQAEVLKIITNHALARMKASAEVLDVRMINSKHHPILQVTDVLLGAITADTNRLLTGVELNDGKKEVIARLAKMIGWDRLCFDTYPNNEFNVWHFPIQFRGRPFPSRAVLLQQPLSASLA